MMTAGSPRVEATVTTVVHLITTLGQGGAERVLSQMVPGPGSTASDGHPERHVVITLVRGGMFADVLTTRGVEVRDLGMRPGRDAVAGTLRLARLLRELQPSVVIAWMYHACLLAMLARPLAGRARRPRTVWMLRGALHTTAGLPWHTRVVVRLLAWRSRSPSAIAINSRAGREQHALAGYRPRAWILVPNGCDTDMFAPDAQARERARRELGLDADALVAIAVARAHVQKDHTTLLSAFARAAETEPRLVLLLVGQGTDHIPVPEAAARAVRALGEREDIPSLLRAADLVISSSITEGLPNALLEAMATGLPVITTDVGDCRRIVGACGVVVPPRDAAALGRALVELAAQPDEQRRSLGTAARERVQRSHSHAAALREYRALWDTGVHGDSERAPAPLEVVHVIARMNVGGPARIISELFDALDPDRFSQRLIVGAVGPEEEDWFALRDPALATDSRVLHMPTFGRTIAPLRDIRTLRRLTRTLRALSPDVVQTHTAKAGLIGRIAARRAGVPRVLHTFHGHTLHGYFSRPVTALITSIERRLAQRTDRLLVVGERVRDELLAAGIGTPEHYEVLPPGVSDPPLPARGTARRALNVDADATVVAFVGRLTAVKRPDRFLAAAERVAITHPGTIFLVAGDGELRSELEAAVNRADVRFLGWQGDVSAIYAASDLVVLTSDNEGMPVTLIEASLAGRACVATDVGSTSEVVLHGLTGLLTRCDPEALAEAIRSLLDDPERRGRFGRAARVHALATFGLAELTRRLAAVYASPGSARLRR